MSEERKKGSVEILCKEIGIRFTPDLERPEVLVAFVRVLHGRLERMYEVNSILGKRFESPIDHSDARQALSKLGDVLQETDAAMLVAGAAEIHETISEYKWEGNWASHIFDIVGSLASALRFGLESLHGLSSRHAAEAAGHLWRHEYGLSKFDEYTSEWQKMWAREMFHKAIQLLSLPADMTRRAKAAGIRVVEVGDG